MLEYLNQLPCEVLGYNMLGYLELIDIIQLERAASSHKWQPLLRAILHYCPPVVLSNRFQWKHEAIHWFNKRHCRVQGVKLGVKLLCELDFEHSILDNIELYIYQDTSLDNIKPLTNEFISQRFKHLKIKGRQDPAVMEVLFSLLTNSSVRSLDSESSNLSQWIEHIKKIGPYLRELTIWEAIDLVILTTITEYCPNLEKLSLSYVSGMSDNNILQSIAHNCPHLRSLLIKPVNYDSVVSDDADLTAFVEKCPQLEELSLHCNQLTDQSVIALAQHCSRLNKLKLYQCKLTATSLIVLSGRGLPLEELDIIPRIPIPRAETAAQCAHALSRIAFLNTIPLNQTFSDCCALLKYMTGLCGLYLDSSDDHLLVPHLLLQGQCCAGLVIFYVGSGSSITLQQLVELVSGCCKLRTLMISQPTCTSDAVLVELARSCPHLQKVILYSSEVTEEGVLALAAHCRQLGEINIPYITVTEETVRQLAQHCRRLTNVHVLSTTKIDVIYSSKSLRAMRE